MGVTEGTYEHNYSKHGHRGFLVIFIFIFCSLLFVPSLVFFFDS